MTPAEVYDLACELIGPMAALVQLGPSRWVLGRWRHLEAGELPPREGGPILRSRVWGLDVLAEGATPADVLAIARSSPLTWKRTAAERAPLLGPGER